MLPVVRPEIEANTVDPVVFEAPLASFRLLPRAAHIASMMSNGRRRSSGSHVQKQQLVGPRGAHVPPAWRSAAREQLSQARRPPGPPVRSQDEAGPSSSSVNNGSGGGLRKLVPQGGSKILVSNLPDDIVENDIVVCPCLLPRALLESV